MYRFGKNPFRGGKEEKDIINPFLIKENFKGKELLTPNDAHKAILEIAANAGLVIPDEDLNEEESDISEEESDG
jgi:hypothetical protein